MASRTAANIGKPRQHGTTWSILTLERTFATLLLVLECEDQPAHHGPTTQLFNRIDATIYKTLRPKDGRDSIRTFASNARTRPGGDFLDAIIDPDYVTYQDTRLDLEHAVNSTYHGRDLLRPKIEHTDEDQRPDRHDAGVARLRSYVTILKAYRCDLPAVHGFNVLKQKMLFYRLNSCDISTAGTAGCDTLEPWLSGIATLYFDDDNNPGRLSNALQAGFVCWDVLGSASREEYALSPLCVARAPGHKSPTISQMSAGRTSAVAASQGFFINEVSGLQKVYRGEESTHWKEKNLLHSLRNKGRLPRLVHLIETEGVYPELTVFPHTKPSPCILVKDQDHAIDTLLEDRFNAGRDKTGTSIFMAVELSHRSMRKYTPRFSFPLQDAVLATESLPKPVIALAFPRGDNDFIANFRAVMKLEKERRINRTLASQPDHGPRHDVESVFWVAFLVAVRALPRHATLESSSDDDVDNFSKFCKAVLDHVVADDVSDDRSRYLKAADFDGLLHPALQPFVGLFETMALYLNVPWHYYEAQGKVTFDHAHVAFRRLLLRFELDLEKDNPAILDLKLHTEHPRVIAWREAGADSTERASTLSASQISHVGASGRENEFSGLPEIGGSTSSKKRKANEPVDRGTGSSKRPATEAACYEGRRTRGRTVL